jgi:hypothetical protein
MTVGELREAIANLPDETPVLYDYSYRLEAIAEASVEKVRHVSDIDEFYQSDPNGVRTLVLG